MKIFVTVGTTTFDSLIEFLDNHLDVNDEILFQVANGKYLPSNFNYIRFTNDIDTMYREYDYIITHAGAGTIYKLLDLKKRFIVVPNLDRVDGHQTDLAQFLVDGFYALSCAEFKEIKPSLEKLPSLDFNMYQKESFFKGKDICKLIKIST